MHVLQTMSHGNVMGHRHFCIITRHRDDHVIELLIILSQNTSRGLLQLLTRWSKSSSWTGSTRTTLATATFASTVGHSARSSRRETFRCPRLRSSAQTLKTRRRPSSVCPPSTTVTENRHGSCQQIMLYFNRIIFPQQFGGGELKRVVIANLFVKK